MLATHADPVMTQFHQTHVPMFPYGTLLPLSKRPERKAALPRVRVCMCGCALRRNDTRSLAHPMLVGVSYANRLGASCTFVVACRNPMMFKSKHFPCPAPSCFVSFRFASFVSLFHTLLLPGPTLLPIPAQTQLSASVYDPPDDRELLSSPVPERLRTAAFREARQAAQQGAYPGRRSCRCRR